MQKLTHHLIVLILALVTASNLVVASAAQSVDSLTNHTNHTNHHVREVRRIKLSPNGATEHGTLRTIPFAIVGTDTLYMDIREPRKIPFTERDSLYTVLFAFGGGFQEGTRNAQIYLPWFDQLNDRGYRVVSIDYRLGLKGKEIKTNLFQILKTADLLKEAVNIAVEDLFSATSYLITHSKDLSIATDRIIASGSSAGAITALTAEREICDGTTRAEVLPIDFNYAGIISFAGAIMSDKGLPQYRKNPCPQLLFHGVDDSVVPYVKMQFGRRAFVGSAALADIYEEERYPYQIYRMEEHDHEVAIFGDRLIPQQMAFLEQMVKGKQLFSSDALVRTHRMSDREYTFRVINGVLTVLQNVVADD